MTWQKLAQTILTWTEEQQQQDVTVHLQSIDEYFGVTLEVTGDEPDVLDANSFYLSHKGYL